MYNKNNENGIYNDWIEHERPEASSNYAHFTPRTSSPRKEYREVDTQSRDIPTPPTPPKTPPPPLPRRPSPSKSPSHVSQSSQSSPVMATSLEYLQDTADSPPLELLLGSRTIGAHIMLYVFRVPGCNDLCISLAKPLRQVITEVDIQLALYYVKAGDEDCILLRNGQIVSEIKGVELNMLGEGYHKFGLSCGNDQKMAYRQHVRHDSRDCTHWSTPWNGHCVIGPENTTDKLWCEHHVNGDSLDKSETISVLKLHLPNSPMSKGMKHFSEPAAALGAATKRLSRLNVGKRWRSEIGQQHLSWNDVQSAAHFRAQGEFSVPFNYHDQALSFPMTNAVSRKPLPATTHQTGQAAGKAFRSPTGRPEVAPRGPRPALPPRTLAPIPTKATPPTLPPRLAPPLRQITATNPATPVYGLGISHSNVDNSFQTSPESMRGRPVLDESTWRASSDSGLNLPPRIRLEQDSPSHDDPTAQSDTSFLALMQERPGGGLQGKDMKLAKIEVWGSGTLMLDMVVAMNVYMFLKPYRSERGMTKNTGQADGFV